MPVNAVSPITFFKKHLNCLKVKKECVVHVCVYLFSIQASSVDSVHCVLSAAWRTCWLRAWFSVTHWCDILCSCTKKKSFIQKMSCLKLSTLCFSVSYVYVIWCSWQGKTETVFYWHYFNSFIHTTISNYISLTCMQLRIHGYEDYMKKFTFT